jgi:NADH-quinone oxidoreductase subunit M
MLWMVQRVLYGEVTDPKNQGLQDLSARELAIVIPLVALSLYMGIFSPQFTRTIEPAVDNLIRQVQAGQRPAPATRAENPR